MAWNRLPASEVNEQLLVEIYRNLSTTSVWDIEKWIMMYVNQDHTYCKRAIYNVLWNTTVGEIETWCMMYVNQDHNLCKRGVYNILWNITVREIEKWCMMYRTTLCESRPHFVQESQTHNILTLPFVKKSISKRTSTIICEDESRPLN